VEALRGWGIVVRVSLHRTHLAQSLAPAAVDAQALELRGPWGLSGEYRTGGGLYIAVAGGCHFRLRDRDLRLDEGDALFLPVGEPHALMDHPSSATMPVEAFCRTAERSGGAMVFGREGALTRILTMGFLFEQRRPWLEGLAPMRLPSSSRRALVRWLIASADLVRSELPDEAKIEVARAVMRVLYALVLAEPTLTKRWVHDDRVARAYARMRQEPSRPWTVDALARVAGMSRSSFAAAFAACLGESPIRHLRRLRLEQARAMSQGRLLPQKAVASRVGYTHTRSLARALRRQTW
jgi:AraC-like DNA-binding protein